MASQEMIVGIVEARFPELVDLAQERVEKIKQLEILNLLAKQIVLAPDEATARWTLGTFAARTIMSHTATIYIQLYHSRKPNHTFGTQSSA